MKIKLPFSSHRKESIDVDKLTEEVGTVVSDSPASSPIIRMRKAVGDFDYKNDIQPYIVQIKIYLPKIIFILKAVESYYKIKTGSDAEALRQVNNVLAKILLTLKTLL